MKTAIIASYPVHLLPGFEEEGAPKRHFATWLNQLSLHLENAPEIEIHWLTLTRSVEAHQVVQHRGQSFHLLPMSKPGKRFKGFYREDRRQLSDCLQEIKPDLVHGWGSEDVNGLAALAFKGPSIISIQGILKHCLFKSLKGAPGETWRERRDGITQEINPHLILHSLIEAYILLRAQNVVVESSWAADILRSEWPHAEATVIEYGPEELSFSTEWRPDPQKPSVIFAGSITQRKGVHDLIKAFADPSLAEVDLILVGDYGRVGQKLRDHATPNVKWLGRRPPPETLELMSKAWCLAIATRADTGPMVAKEARAIGMPVIGSPHAGLISYIENGRNGFLVENGDIPALVKAIAHITSDYQRCREMGAWKHAEQREQLSPKRTAEAFIAFYRRIYSESTNAQ